MSFSIAGFEGGDSGRVVRWGLKRLGFSKVLFFILFPSFDCFVKFLELGCC